METVNKEDLLNNYYSLLIDAFFKSDIETYILYIKRIASIEKKDINYYKNLLKAISIDEVKLQSVLNEIELNKDSVNENLYVVNRGHISDSLDNYKKYFLKLEGFSNLNKNSRIDAIKKRLKNCKDGNEKNLLISMLLDIKQKQDDLEKTQALDIEDIVQKGMRNI